MPSDGETKALPSDGEKKEIESQPSSSLRAWFSDVIKNTNRASTDEEYRKELAKRIT